MKFAMSYSCGKDSTFALHKMIEQGHEPVCLITMVNESVDRSYFHGADRTMLHQYATAFELPLITCPADGAIYAAAFEHGLQEAKRLGAEAACFGDIDIQQNREWEEDRCAAAGLIPVFPLWQQEREAVVRELIGCGYRCLIKSIDPARLPMDLLGTVLDESAIDRMKKAGIDVCGENGEYHTLAVDGPIFRMPLLFQIGDFVVFDDHAIIEII